MVKIRFICVFILLLISFKASSQSITRSVISVCGLTGNDTEGLITFSIGETITGSLITSVNGMSQGFQQPSLSSIEETKIISGINAVEVYPNPVDTDLTIIYNTRTTKLLRVYVYSAMGTIFRAESYSITEPGSIMLNMSSYPCGLYLIHIFSTDLQIDRVFKIEKM